MKFEYLLFNSIIVILPLIGMLFYKKFHFPVLLPALLAITCTAIPFIISDYLLTGYFWDFNSRYITDLKVGKLPIEEILFFITVPFGCLCIWTNIRNTDKNSINSIPLIVINTLAVPGALLSLIFTKHYTFLVLFCIATLSNLPFIRHTLRLPKMNLFIPIVAMLTLIFNGYLTARPVVVYNQAVKTNINIVTIPVEDFFYGFILVTLTVSLYEYFITVKGFKN